jgi:hypothetical protein
LIKSSKPCRPVVEDDKVVSESTSDCRTAATVATASVALAVGENSLCTSESMLGNAGVAGKKNPEA